MNSKKLHQLIVTLFIKYAWAVVIFFAIISAAAVKPAVHLMSAISTNLSELLPDDYKTVQLSQEIKSQFKKRAGSDLVVILESPDAQANKKALDDLTAYIKANPDVESLRIQKPGFDFFDRHKLLFLETADLQTIKDRIQRKIQQEKLHGLYIDLDDDAGPKKDSFDFDDVMDKYRTDYFRGIKDPYYVNPTKTIYAFWIYPKSKDNSLKYYRTFYKQMESYIKDFPLASYNPDMKISYAGSIRTRIDEYSALIKDLKLTGMISLGGCFLLLLLYFRSFTGVIILFIPLISGILLGFALCSLFFDNMNVVTSFLFSILFGLGVDIGIHMFSRYLEDREAGLSVEAATSNIFFKTGRSSATATLTTCATFFILVINDFRGFSEFGWIAGIGLLVTLSVYLLFFPSLLVLAEKLRIFKIKPHKHARREGWLKKYPRFPFPKITVTASLLLLILSAVFLPRLGFEWNYGSLKIQVPETIAARLKLKEVTGRVNSPAAVLIESEEDAQAVKAAILKMKQDDTLSPSIDYFRSSYDLNPFDQKDKLVLLHDIDVLLADDAMNVLNDDKKQAITDFRQAIRETTPILEKEVPQDVLKTFFGEGENSKKQIAFLYPQPHMELDDGRNAINFFDDIHQIHAANGKTYYASSDSLIFADVLKTLFRDSKRAIVFSLLVLAILIYIDFFNFKKSALVFGTLLMGVAWMCGCMAIFGLKFNFYNMITVPNAIGMGEDNSVHLIHRYEENNKDSVMRALFTSGGAALMASLTTMLGYAGLMFAHHPGLKSIGIISNIGLITCMFTSLVFLPAVLQIIADAKRR